MLPFLLHCMVLCTITESSVNSDKTTNELNLPTISSTDSPQLLADIEKKEHKATEEIGLELSNDIPKLTKEIDWKLQYEIKSNIDALNKAITYYQIIFKSLECADANCQCKHIDLNITAESVQRTLTNLNCDYQFSILPGIVYKSVISPSVHFDDEDKSIVLKSHVFSFTQVMDPNILSFALLIGLDYPAYNALDLPANQLSKTLTNEIAEITEINARHITVDIETTASWKVKIKLMITKISHSNQAQVATEKIRNLLFKPDTSLISKIIQKSDSMEVSAISMKAETFDASYNYGVLFLGIIVMAALCWLLTRYSPYKCYETVNFIKLVFVALMRCIKPRMKQCIHYISCLLSSDIARRLTTQYDVLNISEDVELDAYDRPKEDVEMDGIVLLNQIFDEQNTALFTRERCVGILKDNWITKVEQLKQLNKGDWTRLNIPQSIQDAITSKLKSEGSQFIIEGSDDFASSNVDNELSYPVSESDNNYVTQKLDKLQTDEISDLNRFSDF